MLRRAFSIAALFSAAAFGQEARIGKPASEYKVKAVDITVFPDGRGLPAGSGTAAKGTVRDDGQPAGSKLNTRVQSSFIEITCQPWR